MILSIKDRINKRISVSKRSQTVHVSFDFYEEWVNVSQVQRKYNILKYKHGNFWKYKLFIVVRIWVLEKYWHREDEDGMERISQGVLIIKDLGWYAIYAIPKSLDSPEDSKE